MVVFTCNLCGDSLQKPRVEKHYMIACRGAKSLTCMDCLKDFRGEDYAEHTKCVSETQRYAAKGSTVEEVKKGEVKQEYWTNLIKDIFTKKPNVPANYLTHLQTLSRLNNVPRTKDKFVNFMQNSGGRNVRNDLIIGLWDYIEEHKKIYKEDTQEDNKEINREEKSLSESKKKKRSKRENKKINEQLKIDSDANFENQEEDNDKVKTEEKGNAGDENNAGNDSSVQGKPKKRKSAMADNTVNEESCKKQKENGVNNELNSSAAEIKKKKKKGRKNSSVSENVSTDVEINENVNGVLEKEVNNSEIAAQNQETVENGEVKNVDSICVKTKKRKSDVTSNEVDVASCEKQKESSLYTELNNSAGEIKKEKKKKKKNSSAFENLDAGVKINEDVSDMQGKDVNILESAAQNHTIAENGDDKNHDSSIQVKSKKRKSDAASNRVDVETCEKQNENGFHNELSNPEAEVKTAKKKKKNSSYENLNTGAKTNEDVSDLKQVTNSNSGTENKKTIENDKTAKKKDKKRSRASDFFTEENESVGNKEEKISNNENNLGTKEVTTKKKKGEKFEIEKDNSTAESSFSESFLLQDKILDILNLKNSISLNKLQKKVLKAYKKTDIGMSEEKLFKKLNRILKKMDNVEVSDNIVKFIAV